MARDIIHNEVRQSLENDNWTITHDPYSLYLETRTLSIDLGGEKIIGAEKGLEKNCR
jgi:XisH protein